MEAVEKLRERSAFRCALPSRDAPWRVSWSFELTHSPCEQGERCGFTQPRCPSIITFSRPCTWSSPLPLRALRASVFGKLLAGAFLLLTLLVAANFFTTWLAIESAKDTHATHRVLADGNGGVLNTGGEATGEVPLFALQALNLEELRRVRQVSVSYNNAQFAGERVVHSFHIVQHMKVGVSTAVVLTDPLGFKVVLQAFAANLVKPTGERVPLCAASATCASFQVDNADLAALELAAIELLVAAGSPPFGPEERRRLSRRGLTGVGCKTPPERVNLRSAGDYVILSKAGISTVPHSTITGDIGATMLRYH